jgi:hypothetical protein
MRSCSLQKPLRTWRTWRLRSAPRSVTALSGTCDANPRKQVEAGSSDFAGLPALSIGCGSGMIFACFTTWRNTQWRSWESSQSLKSSRGLSGAVKAMKKVPLSELKDDLSKFLRMAENDEILSAKLVACHGHGDYMILPTLALFPEGEIH